MRAIALAGLLALAVTAGSTAQDRPSARKITVYAAASLTDALGELASVFEQGPRRTGIRYNFAGSQQLAIQLEHGARADVFASADQRWMDYVEQRGLTAAPARVFAHNRLVAILPKSNPARIRSLADLARPGVKLVVGAEAVPVGRYSREVIRRLGMQAGFPQGYERQVLANVVSQEENVKSVVAKVQLGEGDAGIVYRSDVIGRAASSLTVLEIPAEANVVAGYPVAILAGSDDSAAARAFVELLLGPEGRRVLARHGLVPAESTP
jgi:molybdate transport system substrate-binding protein